MDINQLLKGINCSCGKRHDCDIKYVYIEKNATRYLTDICKDFQSALIVADQNTYAAAGEITEKVLSEKITKRVIFDGTKILVPDEAAIATVEQSLLGIDIIVGIGSGVIQDL
ncbi:MAG: iron-containing alcohol dehydrogenase, partial [Clostridia bacterium]|nr:iron-containing alcohol dehydrogenase [Clostridia bacterium]